MVVVVVVVWVGWGGGGVKLATAFSFNAIFPIISCFWTVLHDSGFIGIFLHGFFVTWSSVYGVWRLAFGICLMFELWSVMVLGFLFSEIGVCTSEMAEVIFRQVSCFS